MRSHFLRAAAAIDVAPSGPPSFNLGVANIVYTNSNRTIQPSANGQRTVTIGAAHTSGRFYCELVQDVANNSGGHMIGLADSQKDNSYPGGFHESIGWTNGSVFAALTGAITAGGGYGSEGTGVVFGVAVDFDAKKAWVHRNGTYNVSGGDPTTGANPSVYGWTTTAPLFIATRPYFTDDIVSIPEVFSYAPLGYATP